MKNIFIINGHELYPAISEGRLNATFAEMAEAFFVERGCEVKTTTMQDDWNIEEEVQKHMWADFILLQTPVNWMGVAWSCKKYMDVVYTAGLDGRLCDGDGRTRKDPSKQYGSGGTLTGKKYMLSLTFNAPKAAFDDPGQFLFQGKGVDELFLPAHMNFRFFNMEPVKTFVCYDVMKNPDVSSDFTRFDAHLRDVFSELS